MASDNKFSHISVNAGDDDVVIHAGVPAAVEADAQPVAEEVAAGQPVADDGIVADSPEEDVQPAAEAAARPAKAAYHETTLEDIQGSRMGATQKVVIVLAVLLMVAIAVWQVAFNG